MEITRIIASKHNGEIGGTQTILDIGSTSTATLTVSIPEGYVFYILDISANATTSDTTLDVRRPNGQTIFSLSEVPDTFAPLINYPFLRENFQGNISVLFTNNASVTTTITFVINGILIPFENRESFEADLYNYAMRR